MPKKTGKVSKSASKANDRKSPAKTSVRQGAASAARRPRRLKLVTKLPNALQLAKSAAQLFWRHKKLFIGITIVYGLLNLILVKGFSSGTDITSLKSQLSQVFHGDFGPLASGLSIFVVMVGSAGNGSSATAGAYQVFLAIIVSLAVIWALRQVMSGAQLRIRDTYYLGMYPLVPFILVLLIIAVQLLPLVIGSAIYSIVVSNGIAVHTIEKIIWLIIFIALALWSLYMVSASAFALYIVTLPDMTPMKAWRSARDLVKRRRWSVLRKILSLPIMLLIIAAIIMLPIIIWLTVLAQWVFFVLTMFVLTAVHTYMYTLYRELLNE